MIRARRIMASAAVAHASGLQRLVRQLHAAGAVHSASASALVRLRPSTASAVSRFGPTPTRGRAALLPSNGQQQIRWRSAMTTEQEDQLTRHMDELAACRDNGNWRQALKLLDHMDKQGFALDADMYELAMAACARMGKIEVLPGLLQNMDVDALLPTHRTVDFVMQAYIAAEQWPLLVALAKDVSAKGVPLSDAAFQAAFESCGKMRDATSARQILLNAEQAGQVALGVDHYAMAIRACGMGGRADLAASLFVHMEEKRGLDADGDVFNHLIRSQIVNGALPQALQTFATANERGDVALPESIYTATIDALVTAGEFWQASQLFSQMVAHDELAPSVFCYGRMMVAYVRLNRHELARECWQRVLAIDEDTPSLTKYAKMVSQLATTNANDLAVEIFEHLFPHHDPAYIRDSTYAAAIRAYGRLGRAQTAVDLFDTFVANRRRVNKPMPRSAGIYLAVFNALSRDSEQRDPAQNSHDAQRVWDIMVESVPVVLAPAYASLAGVLASSGDLSTLEELMDHAKQSLKSNHRQFQQQQPYGRRAGGRGRVGSGNDFHPAFGSPFDALESEDVDDRDDDLNHRGHDHDHHAIGDDDDDSGSWHDELLFNGVISGFSKARSDQSQRVMDYLSTMRERGMKISDSIVRASTDTFIKHAQWPFMFELLEFVDLRDLQNAELCLGDTISKLLEAQAWEPARFWIARAHRLGVQPPIRGKMEILSKLRAIDSDEWQIAYALARETLSFKKMIQENVDSVADAAHVCSTANRSDLVIKLFERTATHPSVVRGYHEMRPPLRLFKQTLLACMREQTTTPDFGDGTVMPLQKAEAFCAQMLQSYPARRPGDGELPEDSTLDGDALSLAISIKATMGDDDDVLALFEKMRQLELTPNSYAFNAAINAYSRAKNLDAVLAIRDDLVAHHNDILLEPKVAQSLLFSLAIVPDDKLLQKHLTKTRKLLPNITSNHVVNTFLSANRVGKCVEHFDETVSLDTFQAVLRRILDGPRAAKHKHSQAHERADIALAAQLLLKFIAFHGLDQVKPPGLVLRTSKRLLQAGKRRESLAILSLYNDPNSEVALADLNPAFQKDVLEMLLYIHGEDQRFDALGDMFDKPKPSAVALDVGHFQLAMKYCVVNAATLAAAPPPVGANGKPAKKMTKKQREELVVQGATTCLKLFETLRMQYVKPNGPVYYHALQSCLKLGRLEATGTRVLGDAVDQGFTSLLGSELYRQTSLAIEEREALVASDKPPTAMKVDVKELATLALFCHHQGLPISWNLGNKLLELRASLPKGMCDELQHIVAACEAAYAANAAKRGLGEPTPAKSVAAVATLGSKPLSRAVRAALPARKPPSPVGRRSTTTTGRAGARWGE